MQPPNTRAAKKAAATHLINIYETSCNVPFDLRSFFSFCQPSGLCLSQVTEQRRHAYRLFRNMARMSLFTPQSRIRVESSEPHFGHFMGGLSLSVYTNAEKHFMSLTGQ
jgi:hypothetical protein